MVTLKDIAALCGVSPATVSRALNAKRPRTERCRTIRQTAQRMGYRPNANARALKTNRSRCIGILYEDMMSHEFFSSLIDGIRVSAEREGYDLFFLSRRFDDGSDTYISQAGYRMLDGVIVVQADFSSPRIRALAASGIPVVCVDGLPGEGMLVESDNIRGMETLAEYVLSMGHRRLAYIRGEEGPVTQERAEGFLNALKKHGMDPGNVLFFAGRYRDPAACREPLVKILGMEERPSCIFFPDDFTCAAGIRCLEGMGLRVPEDISVTGYDGIEIGRVMSPRLTTYRQNAQDLAETAVRKIVDALAGKTLDEEETSGISGCLIPGETVLDRTKQQDCTRSWNG